MELSEAYRECERITWSQARNFAYGIRLLPPAKRRGLAVIYAFARRIDDIGDGTLPPEEKIAALEQARQAIATATAASQDDPVLLALADVERNFPVPMPAFGELIDGCVADVRGTSYQTFDDLLYYCRCVAGSIGRLSLGIFGTSHDADPKTQAAELADSLGVALQLTNILRDIREDHQNGRIYLPAEDLAKFSVDFGGTTPPRPPPPFLPGGPIPPDPPWEGPPAPPYPPGRDSSAWSSSRPSGPATGTPPAGSSCPCSTAAARPAPVPWPASTAACWSASPPSPPPSCAAGCRCPAGKRPRSRSRP